MGRESNNASRSGEGGPSGARSGGGYGGGGGRGGPSYTFRGIPGTTKEGNWNTGGPITGYGSIGGGITRGAPSPGSTISTRVSATRPPAMPPPAVVPPTIDLGYPEGWNDLMRMTRQTNLPGYGPAPQGVFGPRASPYGPRLGGYNLPGAGYGPLSGSTSYNKSSLPAGNWGKVGDYRLGGSAGSVQGWGGHGGFAGRPDTRGR